MLQTQHRMHFVCYSYTSQTDHAIWRPPAYVLQVGREMTITTNSECFNADEYTNIFSLILLWVPPKGESYSPQGQLPPLQE